MLCTPTGIECYQDIKLDLKPYQGKIQRTQSPQKKSTKTKCLIECQGIYADVFRTEIDKDTLLEQDLISKYRHFKKGFAEKINYPKSIKGE